MQPELLYMRVTRCASEVQWQQCLVGNDSLVNSGLVCAHEHPTWSQFVTVLQCESYKNI